MQAIDNLIEENKGLVYAQLHKLNLVKDPEAESIAYEALYNAILKYDASKGTKLSTVATVYIYNALGCYVRSLNAKRQIKTVSYNNTSYKEDGIRHDFLELIPSDCNIEEEFIEKEMRIYTIKLFNKLYDNLTNEKHKQILSLWRESDFVATTKDISKQAGVSQSYVSQVINNFKHSLRKKLKEAYYE